MELEQHQATLQKCWIGLGSLAGGFTLSLTLVENILRVASLAVGLAVGIATLISIIRKKDK